jgi:Predicted membrane protein
MEKFIQNFDAHQRVAVSLAVGILIFVATLGLHRLPLELILSWNAFAITAILLAWVRIIFADAKCAVLEAKLQDTGRTVIFCLVLFGACASLFAVAFLLGTAKGTGGARLGGHVFLAAITVVLSWFLIHTVFSMHYAHSYYRTEDPDEHGRHGAGLNFPGDEDDEPDFLDFAYFAFVIGMTFQVSDVAITSKLIRRLSLVHALLSFLFNTVILALAINLASSLVGG